MSERRAAFEEAAQAASAERRSGERTLVHRLADEFRGNPAAFDPRRLTFLSPRGRGDFLKALDVSQARGARSAGAEPKNAEQDHRPAVGWAELRRPESSTWLSGVGHGAAFGTLILVFALLLSATLG